MALGKGPEAISAAERSLEVEPDNAVTALNLTIWRSNLSNEPREIKPAFEAWSSRFLSAPDNSNPLGKQRVSGRAAHARIRIGYISGDLSNHPVRYFIEPYFRTHDASRFDVHAFMTGQEDDISGVLKEWVPNCCLLYTSDAADE